MQSLVYPNIQNSGIPGFGKRELIIIYPDHWYNTFHGRIVSETSAQWVQVSNLHNILEVTALLFLWKYIFIGHTYDLLKSLYGHQKDRSHDC